MNHYSVLNGEKIEREHLNEFLQRENNLLDNLIQIYKQFIKLDTTNEGHAQLNKKLCVVESLKLYVEHLVMFHKFDLLIPPSLNSLENSFSSKENSNSADQPLANSKSYLNEIQIDFKLIQNRWTKRREEQLEFYKSNKDTYYSKDENAQEKNFPFTYMIDCILEDCKMYANVSKFFINSQIAAAATSSPNQNAFKDEEFEDLFNTNIYPPKSIYVWV